MPGIVLRALTWACTSTHTHTHTHTLNIQYTAIHLTDEETEVLWTRSHLSHDEQGANLDLKPGRPDPESAHLASLPLGKSLRLSQNWRSSKFPKAARNHLRNFKRTLLLLPLLPGISWIRIIGGGDRMHRRQTTVNNTVLYAWKL